MSGQTTLSIRKLAALTQNGNTRLAEPLLAYALEIGEIDKLLGLTTDEHGLKEYRSVIEMCRGDSLTKLDAKTIKELPWSYQKLLNTWKAVESKPHRIQQSKQLRLDKTLELMKAKRVKKVQIYRDLNLNPGNTNAYLKHKDTSKLSLENATRIMKYLYAL
jgi:hypothetical protein